jgi:DNA-binding CsgD family transcriptional regulator
MTHNGSVPIDPSDDLGNNARRMDLLSRAIESLPHPFYVIRASDYSLKLVNFAARSAAGSPATTCYAMTHGRNEPCSGKEHICPLEEVKKSKKPVVVEHLHYDKQKGPRDVEVRAFPILDKQGEVDLMVEYCLDITDRKQAERELSHYRQHLSQLVDQRTTELKSANQRLEKEVANRKQVETQLKKSSMELELEREALQRKNTALSEILDQIDAEKSAFRQQILTNMEQAVMPILVRLRDSCPPSALINLEALENELAQITSPFLEKLRGNPAKLSPRQLEVCRLIKSGMTTKEIADLLNRSPLTINKYREQIRKKFGLVNSHSNLHTFLQSL